MSTLDAESNDMKAANVEFARGELIVTLNDGRRIATPLRWYPKLAAASDFERANFEVMPFGIHWPALDEDLSIAGMLRGETAPRESSELYPTYYRPLPDSLTSLLRPFSPHQSLQTSQVRLQQTDVLMDIASRARAAFDREGLRGNPVPYKFLVPFLEKASLEDWADDLREAWVNLLLRAATKYDTKLNVYVDILSKIGAREALFLQRVYNSRRSTGGFAWPEGPFKGNAAAIEHSISQLVYDNPEPAPGSALYQIEQKMWNDYIKRVKLDYGIILHATILTSQGTRFFYNTEDIAEGAGVFIDILEREQLLKRTYFKFGAQFQVAAAKMASGSVGFAELTYMGFDFVRVCTGEDRKG